MIKKTPEQVETISPMVILSSVGHGYNGNQIKITVRVILYTN